MVVPRRVELLTFRVSTERSQPQLSYRTIAPEGCLGLRRDDDENSLSIFFQRALAHLGKLTC